jgi:hypothetical protein
MTTEKLMEIISASCIVEGYTPTTTPTNCVVLIKSWNPNKDARTRGKSSRSVSTYSYAVVIKALLILY